MSKSEDKNASPLPFAGGSLFGNAQPSAGSLFGNPSPGGGLFGNVPSRFANTVPTPTSAQPTVSFPQPSISFPQPAPGRPAVPGQGPSMFSNKEFKQDNKPNPAENKSNPAPVTNPTAKQTENEKEPASKAGPFDKVTSKGLFGQPSEGQSLFSGNSFHKKDELQNSFEQNKAKENDPSPRPSLFGPSGNSGGNSNNLFGGSVSGLTSLFGKKDGKGETAPIFGGTSKSEGSSGTGLFGTSQPGTGLFGAKKDETKEDKKKEVSFDPQSAAFGASDSSKPPVTSPTE
jgi:hypothetical protein